MSVCMHQQMLALSNGKQVAIQPIVVQYILLQHLSGLQASNVIPSGQPGVTYANAYTYHHIIYDRSKPTSDQ